MTEFVTTPTEQWLKSELEHCTEQLLISSPYVGGWLPKLQGSLPAPIRRVLLTRADLRDFASGASDLEAVCASAIAGTEIITSHRLHAKVYVIDGRCGLVTSANATFSGMRGNIECGVVIRDSKGVLDAARLILSAFGAREIPQKWTLTELQSLREPVYQIRQTLSAKQIIPALEERLLPDIHPESPVGRALLEHLPGWSRLALEGIQMQPSTFNLDGFVAACGPLAAARFPNNRHVRAKLRQQLQRMRDLGIIEFLGKGNYQRNSQVQ